MRDNTKQNTLGTSVRNYSNTNKYAFCKKLFYVAVFVRSKIYEVDYLYREHCI